MTSSEFNLVMDTECERCHQPAKLHRLTKSGRFYCLQPQGWRQKIPSATWVYTCKVAELIRSPLPQSIGKLINGELTGHPVNVGEQMAL